MLTMWDKSGVFLREWMQKPAFVSLCEAYRTQGGGPDFSLRVDLRQQ